MISKRFLGFISIMLAGLVFVLSACQSANASAQPGASANTGMGMGNSGMMTRHSAPIPEEFASLTNPVAADEESLARGKEIFTTNCVVCHGEGGMGDGPSAVNLDPQPVAIAHTSQMMSDAYLFWRITEGGVPFETAMIPYGGILDEQARWDVINYVRSLGSGSMAGGMDNMNSEAVMRAEMLTQAIEQGVITQEEAELFETVHSAIDAVQMGGMGNGNGMGMHGMGNGQGMGNGMGNGMENGMGNEPMMNGDVNAILAGLVEAGTITQEQADAFLATHLKLEDAGLMK